MNKRPVLILALTMTGVQYEKKRLEIEAFGKIAGKGQSLRALVTF